MNLQHGPTGGRPGGLLKPGWHWLLLAVPVVFGGYLAVLRTHVPVLASSLSMHGLDAGNPAVHPHIDSVKA